MFNHRVRYLFDQLVNVVFSIILLFIIFGIAIGTVQLFISVWKLLAFEGITGHYIDLIADVLTIYVLIELSRSLVEYFNSHRLRLTFIADAAIVFTIREVMILMFKHEVKPDMLYAFSALLLVLGAIRIGSILVYQREKTIPESSSH
ncbi:MAG: phosphate-starvation-inducible PsiE family protein [Pseudomonadales bacterium]|nr:phosphate-starvation-inducible PsiE family protein [Pseudomonadales bacterium]